MGDTGSLQRDNNNNNIQVASAMEAFDGGSNASPLAYNGSGGAIITLTRGTNAKEMVFRPSTDMRLSTTQSDLSTNYVVYDADTWFVIPVGREASIYIRSNTVAAGTLQFYFHTV